LGHTPQPDEIRNRLCSGENNWRKNIREKEGQVEREGERVREKNKEKEKERARKE